MNTMRVLMANTRADAMQAWGGDTTQVIETRKCLQQLGTIVDLAGEEPPHDLSSYDVVHLFNMLTAENGLDLLERTKALGKPVALSTIYWDPRYARHPDNVRFGESRLWAKLAFAAPRLAIFLQNLRQVRGKTRLLHAQRMLLSAADVILPNSVAELENLVARFRLPSLRGKAFIVPNAVSPPAPPSSAPHEMLTGLPDKFALMAAGFHPIKGQARLIQALMQDPQIPLVFVGRGSTGTAYGNHCHSLASRRGNTFFVGAVPHELMPQLYRRAKVHALPSLRETTGLVSLEAAVHGANCVVAIHAPVQEYFGLDCFICDPMSPASVRKAVLAAWDAPPNDNLRSRILKEFTWQRAAEETLRGYHLLLSKRSTSFQGAQHRPLPAQNYSPVSNEVCSTSRL
jgi:glycosyltransferase involved in cell wall biosynthesis